MYKLIKKSEANVRNIAENKIARNYVTKDLISEVSLATTEAKDYYEKETANYNRIYFVLEGQLILIFDNQKVVLDKDDVCFVEKGTTYEMKGTFKAIMVNQPAFGT